MHIFSGLYKSRAISSPKGLKTRPTSGRLRETLFNICQGDIENASFLDLFAGSGAMGLEALSRGAQRATFVDNSRESIRCIQENLRSLGLEKHSQVIYGDVFETMKVLAKKVSISGFDIIYADPPYDTWIQSDQEKVSLSTQVIRLLDELIGVGSLLLRPNGSLFIEDSGKVAPDEHGGYQNLVLRSQRSMGRSVLQHWVRL